MHHIPLPFPATPRAVLEENFKDFVLSAQHPCLGAKSVFRNDAYQIGHYEMLGSTPTASALAADLRQFIQDRPAMSGEFTSFVAMFDYPLGMEEAQFEQLLWQQLTLLHELDDQPWDATASSDPEDKRFGFSFGGTAFFIVGLHANSTRLARRFSHPVLVFNAHDQFERLREGGKFVKMRKVIRCRDKAWQGSVNPMMADFGTVSEARQYSGRAVSPEWKCPFQHKSAQP